MASRKGRNSRGAPAEPYSAIAENDQDSLLSCPHLILPPGRRHGPEHCERLREDSRCSDGLRRSSWSRAGHQVRQFPPSPGGGHLPVRWTSSTRPGKVEFLQREYSTPRRTICSCSPFQSGQQVQFRQMPATGWNVFFFPYLYLALSPGRVLPLKEVQNGMRGKTLFTPLKVAFEVAVEIPGLPILIYRPKNCVSRSFRSA